MNSRLESMIEIDSRIIGFLKAIDFHPKLKKQLELVLKEYEIKTKEDLEAILEDLVRPGE